MDSPDNRFAPVGITAGDGRRAKLSRGDRSGRLTLLLPTELHAVGRDEHRQPDGSDHSTRRSRRRGRSDLLLVADMASGPGGGTV